MKPNEMRMALVEVRSLSAAARDSVNEHGEANEQAVGECIRLLQKVLRASRANGTARNAAGAADVVSYQVRYAHTTQRETFDSLDEATSAVESVFPRCYSESYDAGNTLDTLVWTDEAAFRADLDGSRTCARIVEVAS